MSVEECMEKVSIREYKIWMYRFGMEIGEPSRSDYYLMMVASEIRRIYKSLVRDKTPMSLKDFELPIKKPIEKKKLTKDQKKAIVENSKSKWKMFLTRGKNSGN